MNETEYPVQDRAVRSAKLYNYLHRYFNLLQSKWWVLLITLALGLGTASYLVMRAPPKFYSVGRMIMNLKITTSSGTGAGFAEEFSNFIGTQSALMKSARVLQRAYERVRELKPELTPIPVDLEISVTPKTTIFNLRATGEEPQYTRAFLDACVEEYLALKVEMRANTSETTLQRILEQLDGLDRKLQACQAEESAFITNNNVVFIREQVKSLAEYMVQKNRLLDTYRSEYQFLTLVSVDQILDRQQTLAAQSGREGVFSAPNAYLNSDFLRARQELLMRRVEMEDWAKILRPKHPRMIAMKEDIDRRENLLKIFKDQSKEQLQSQRDSLGLQITNLVRETRELETRSIDLNSKLTDYDRILTSKINLQNLRDNLQRAMQSLGIEKDINPDSVTPLERATEPRSAKPPPLVWLIRGGVLGLLAGLLILFVVDRFDDRPSTFTDLNDLFDEQVMGQIPLDANAGRKRGRVPLLMDGDDRHMFFEAYRNLRSSLLYMATEGVRPKVLVVTSAIPGDGKSLTTANLAITMALAGARVLLVDADLRKGSLHKAFGIDMTAGLSEVLNGKSLVGEAIISTPMHNLSLLPRGVAAHNPGELFVKPVTHELIKDLASQYDYVIFDTAPVMAADDVTSLSPHVEGVLFVIRANYTSGRVARAALDLLYQREANVLGLVFNCVQTRSSDYYYYRYKEYYATSA